MGFTWHRRSTSNDSEGLNISSKIDHSDGKNSEGGGVYNPGESDLISDSTPSSEEEDSDLGDSGEEQMDENSQAKNHSRWRTSTKQDQSNFLKLMSAGVVLVVTMVGVFPDLTLRSIWYVGIFLLLGLFYLKLPTVLAWVLSESVTRFALFGYPFCVSTLSLCPWIEDGMLHVRIFATNIRFANPEGFPHDWFVQCKKLDLIIAVPINKLPSMLLFKKTPMPLKTNPDFECLAVLEVPHIDFDGISINFELKDGKFNINELTREIAIREVNAHIAHQQRVLQVKKILSKVIPGALLTKLGIEIPESFDRVLFEVDHDDKETEIATPVPEKTSTFFALKNMKSVKVDLRTVGDNDAVLPVEEDESTSTLNRLSISKTEVESIPSSSRFKIFSFHRRVKSQDAKMEIPLVEEEDVFGRCIPSPKKILQRKYVSHEAKAENKVSSGLTSLTNSFLGIKSSNEKINGEVDTSVRSMEESEEFTVEEKTCDKKATASRLKSNPTSSINIPTVKAVHSTLSEVNMPNRLEVTIIRAKDIKTADRTLFSGERSSDPKVVVRLRENQFSTSIRYNSVSPMWNESFTFDVTDPSSVLHVAMYDQDFGHQEFIGQWIITLKWLIMNPKYCWYNEDGFESGIGCISGWFPMMNRRWKAKGELGDINMKIRWYYDAAVVMPPETSKSALFSLDQNSKETNLRLGNKVKVKQMLSRVPILFNINRVSIRNVEFFLQDLFRGSKGQAEKLSKMGMSSNEAGKVKIPLLDWTKTFHPRKGEPGITTYKVLYSFFIRGVFPKIFNHQIFGNALSQTASGFAFNMVNNTQALFKGQVGLKSVVETGKKIGSEFRTVGIHVKKKLLNSEIQNRVTADDEDFLMESRIEDILYKCTIVNPKSSDDLNPPLRQFTKCKVQFKGGTLFYQPLDRTEARKICKNEMKLVALRLAKNDFALHRVCSSKYGFDDEAPVGKIVRKVTIFRFIDEEAPNMLPPSNSKPKWKLGFKSLPEETTEALPMFNDRLKEWFDVLKEVGLNTVIRDGLNY